MSAAATPGGEQAVLDPADLAPLAELEAVARDLAAGGAAREGEPAILSIGNLWGSAQALVLAALSTRPPLARTPLWVVTSTEGEAEAFAADLAAFGLGPTSFPARESYSSRRDAGHADTDAIRARLQVAQRLGAPPGERPRVLVASILALLQPVPSLRVMESEFLRLRVGEMLDATRLLKRLVKSGYVRQPLAEAPGEVSLRGDLLDLFPFASDLPVRVELFEDEIESLRTFEPDDQRSIESFAEVELCLAADAGGIREGRGVQVMELCPAGTVLVEVEPLRVEEEAERLRIQSPAHERALRDHLRRRKGLSTVKLQSLPGEDHSLDTRSVQALQVGMRDAAAALQAAVLEGSRVVVLCPNEGDARRARELLVTTPDAAPDSHAAEPGLDLAAPKPGAGAIEVRVGAIAKGFRAPPWGLILVNHHELKGTLGVRRRAGPKTHLKVRAIQSFFELKTGDLVVHAVHGLARYMGLERVQRGGGEEEHLHLLFADEVSLFVPSSRIDMVQRYIGAGASHLPLDRIGSSVFRKRKERVQRGLFDLASELIEVQAKRALHTRPAWSADAEMVRDLVEAFPHDDTQDQTTIDAEVAADLASPHPMDRLLCGDVGFGKTELAVRAAFRVVSAGGQVAVLVPTTVLAQQHYETFRDRLADFAVTVEVLSRYISPTKAREVIERTQRGQVDVLVGTHRMLSKDVTFQRLGLVVVDEEQRFGVQHKEHFKKLRAEIDILTMTATPIPRTLHMSLSGIRDISALTQPPAGRQEIETILGYGDDHELIREALLREKNRGGQVFFLHNRVASIEAVAQRLRGLAPSCSYAVGHGQMGSRELRRVMDAFTQGEVDVLVATTIIENGLDIPSAGTILVDDADHFGLSELHQLRGRVGRGSHKAFCYLLVERHKPLRDVARERLKALEEMNQLGAGFGISIKDLELRGAGNVLGAEQSGHIAAVGYDMYCRLLKSTVERIQAGERLEAGTRPDGAEEGDGGVELELGLRALLPEDWIASQDTRIELLRRLARIGGDADARAAEEELRDRFGRVPAEAQALLRTFRLKARLDPYGLRRVAWQGDTYLIQYTDRVAFERLFATLDVDLRRIRRGVAHLMIPAGQGDAETALEWFEGLLRRVEDAATMPAAE